MAQTALKYELAVPEDGRLEIVVPFPPGSHITVFVVEEPETQAEDDLLAAATSSLDFWDNPWDDEDWNDA